MSQPILRFLSFSASLVLGILLLPHLSSAQVTSSDPNFTPAVLKSGLSAPSGLAFRSAAGDLVLSQFGTNQVSLVSASSGATKPFASQQAANEVAVRASDGLVAVNTNPGGPIDFYDSNGSFVNSIAAGSPDSCIGGLAFDASGNLFVAAGPLVVESVVCSSSGWNIYEFPGPSPWSNSPSGILESTISQIEGLAFSAAPLPSGVLYAVSPASGEVFQIAFCSDCSLQFANTFAQVSTEPNPGIWGIAVDPLLGDLYISESTGGSVLRVPPPDFSCECLATPSTFATGFSNSKGIAFDTNGNLYVNETNTGKLWKFSRASFPTPQQLITLGQTLTFTNPNSGMSDQVQTILIPTSAKLNGAVYLQDIFVQVLPATLNAKMLPGSQGDPEFFGGGPVPPNSKCVQVPSANNNCLVTIQKCYDVNHKPFDICPVQEPSTSSDLIQLTSTFAAPTELGPALFLIDFDTPPDNTTLTDITTTPLDCCTGSGGTKGLCSKTFFATAGTVTGGDFSVGPISPSPINVAIGGSSAPSSVPVTSINGFTTTVFLSVTDAPGGVTATLSQSSVTPTDTSTTLTVAVSSSFDSANTIAGLATVLANLQASGCIDNSGIANALSSKLSGAQDALGKGQIQTAINTLSAFKTQVQAQAGKHISMSCTTSFTLIVKGFASPLTHLAAVNVNVTGTNAASILSNDVSSIIGFLGQSSDPITGFVFQGGSPAVGATVSLTPGPLAPVTTDITGFYYFPGTSSLNKGTSYTIQVGSLSQIFTWGGKGLAFNFTLP